MRRWLPENGLGMGPLAFGVLWCLGWLSLAAFPGVAQMPLDPGQAQPSGMPPEPAEPDTVTAHVELPAEWPVPVGMTVVPDTVRVGDTIWLVLDFDDHLPGAEATAWADSLEHDAGWLEPRMEPELSWWRRLTIKATGGGGRPIPADVEPRSTGSRRVAAWRVYRTDPFRIAAGDDISPIITVVGRTEGLGDVAAIRDPDIPGWNPTVPLAVLLALVLLIVVARWLWRRRTRHEMTIRDWPVAPPAWLAAVVQLRQLLQDDLLSRGEGRIFLDRLAHVVRQYVSGRYRIAALEMTGREITDACRALGYRSEYPQRLGDLVGELDRRRYDPTELDLAGCRRRVAELFAVMAEVRIEARYTPVPAADQLAADQAWAHLQQELGPLSLATAGVTATGDDDPMGGP